MSYLWLPARVKACDITGCTLKLITHRTRLIYKVNSLLPAKVEAKSWSDTDTMFHSRVLPIWRQQWLFSFPSVESSSSGWAAQEYDAACVMASPEPSISAYYLNASHSLHFLVKHQQPAVTLTPSPNISLLPLPSHTTMTDALAKHKVICLLCSVLHWLLIFPKWIVLPSPPTRTISPAFSLCQVLLHQKDLSDWVYILTSVSP